MAKEVRKVHISVTSNASKNLNKGTAAATGLSGALKGVGTSASLATGGIRSMTMALVSSGVGAFVVAIGALISGLGTVINTSRRFSKSLSGLKAVLGDAADDAVMARLADDAKRLGSATSFTAMQVVELQTEFSKIGFDTDQILNATEATLDLAAATGTDLAEAAAVAGATLRGFGLTSDQTGRVADVMAKSFSKSALDMSAFTESMKLVAPIAKTVRVPIEQATAALGILANNGVKGSMAGTQLRRVLSDLAQKTGVNFRDSLTLTSERLAAATSDAEKLAIAKELVGDRAKGTLIALAENTEALDEMTIAMDNASGAAKQMADDALDNLDGDLTKLGSAWEGFILSLEDGNGIISKISRGGVQILTGLIDTLKGGMREASAAWIFFSGQFEASIPMMKVGWVLIKKLGLSISKMATEAKIALADVPLIGGAFDKAKLQEDLKGYDKGFKELNKQLVEYSKESIRISTEAEKEAFRVKFGITEEGTVKAEEVKKQITEDFKGSADKKDEEARKKAEADRKAFLLKLKKLEEDTDDQTALEKIERKRQRHLDELATIKMNATERKEAEQTINDIYDEKAAEQKAKNLAKFNSMFGDGGMSALDKIEADRAKHLLELDALEISETEKEELRKRIREHYDGLRDEATNKNLDAKRKDIEAQIDEERRLQEARRQALYQTLDTAAEVAGKETAMGKALMAIKLAMQLKELGIKMGLIKDELAIKAQAAMTEAGVEGAKVGTATAQGMAETSKIGFPWNVISMAGYALQAATLVKTFAGQKKKLASIAGKAGAAGSSGSTGSAPPAPPSFNVIGGTSAGDELVASTISQVNNRPMRAYVVDSDVTTSQELQRNTETIASIG